MSIKNILLITCGFLALGLGAVGVFFPIMPTTPFVIVSAACFGGSSPRLYSKLRNTKYFGDFIDNYKNKTGIAKAVKCKSIAFLWSTLIISSFIFRQPLVLLILAIVGVAVTAHILLIKNQK